MGKVHQVPPKLVTSGTGQSIRAAAPVVGGSQWQPMALAQNWLFGRGNTLITAGAFHNANGDYEIDPGDTLETSHYVAENATATTFLWMVTLSLNETGTSASGTFLNFSGDEIGQWSIGAENPTGWCKPFEIVHQGGDLQGTFNTAGRYATLKVVNDAGSQGSVFLANLKLIELPRTQISTITDQRTLQSGEPIFDDGVTDSVTSLWGTQKLFIDALSASRRACLYSFVAPVGVPYSTTTATFDNVTGNPINVFYVRPFQPRSLRGETTTTLEWIAAVKGTGGAGELRIRTGSAGAPGITDSVTVTIASGGPTLMNGTIDARTEDVNNLDGYGWRSDFAEYLEINLRVTTATSVQCYGFWLREPR